MFGAMLYVNAGKGHYVPAKAAYDALLRTGHTGCVEDMFAVLNSPFWQWFCRAEWRFLLRHPQLERVFHTTQDTRFSAFLLSNLPLILPVRKAFVSWYETTKPDFILCTNFLGGVIITAIAKKEKLKAPIFVYAADVFNNPSAGFNRNIDRIFVPSLIGQENLYRQGYRKEQVVFAPFPLQSSVQTMERLSKQEARKILNLEERFTLLLNFGGEGIGSTALVEELGKRGMNWQIVVVGTLREQTKTRLASLANQYPQLRIESPGFVTNIGTYMCACDVQAGKAGANALMESMALKRPFMISELLHAARDTARFFARYQVGWVVRNHRKQADILQGFAESEAQRKAMEERLAKLPISFDSDQFITLLLEQIQTCFLSDNSLL
ncbi:MAG: UDP-N-acetylglucosamine--LPS N-acetylglucosamine transferase [Spirochaetales bacterium]|nr:UDP-N-acetylglucosamine--LPS N-acetylglucosamine transferase [Spirochaetales bacterium]